MAGSPWKVFYDGEDITDKVESFTVSGSVDSFCFEISVDVSDADVFGNRLDWGKIPVSPKLRLEYSGATFLDFFVEEPRFEVQRGFSRFSGVWGRSVHAKLSPPFAAKCTKTYTAVKMLSEVFADLCLEAEMLWTTETDFHIPDREVLPGTFSVTNEYPIEAMSRLAALAGAVIVPGLDGHVKVVRIDYAVAGTPVGHVDDGDIEGCRIEVTVPEFGNRVRILGTSAGTQSLTVHSSLEDDPCLSAEGVVYITVQVTDELGPVQGVKVEFSNKWNRVVLDKPAVITGTIRTTKTIKASNKYEASLPMAPTRVVSVYSVTRGYNVYGFSLEGNTLHFSVPLLYCDEELSVTYELDGAGVVSVRKKPDAEAGIDEILVKAGDQVNTLRVIVDDPCACRPSVQIFASPDRIYEGGMAQLMAVVTYANGPVSDGRKLWWTVKPKSSATYHGYLWFTESSLGEVEVTNFPASIQSQEEGTEYVYYVTLPMIPSNVTHVSLTTTDCPGDWVPFEWNPTMGSRIKLKPSFNRVPDGSWACVSFKLKGAAVNGYKGTMAGVDEIRAIVKSDFVEPIYGSTDIVVSRPPEGLDDDDILCLCPDPGFCPKGTEDYKMICPDGKIKYCPKCKDEPPPCRCPDPGTCAKGTEYYSFRCPDGTYKQCLKCKEEPPPCPCPNTGVCSGGLENYVYYCAATGKNQTCQKCKGSPPPPDPITKPKKDDEPPKGCCDKGDPQGDIDTGSGGKKKFDGETGDCYGTKCNEAGKSCCQHITTKKMGCYPHSECDTSGSSCAPDDVWANPTPEYTQSRFAKALAKQCTCDDICRAEVSRDHSSPSYDNASGVAIEEKLAAQGWTQEDADRGDPNYWSAYDAIAEEMINACKVECGACEGAEALVISGPNAVTSPGQYQYTVSGGIGPYEFSLEPMKNQYGTVIGKGNASISGDGLLTLGETACGSWLVKVTDACGAEKEKSVMITNGGRWDIFIWARPAYGEESTGACPDGDYCYIPGVIWKSYYCTDDVETGAIKGKVICDDSGLVCYCDLYSDCTKCYDDIKRKYTPWMEANCPEIVKKAIRERTSEPWITVNYEQDSAHMIIGFYGYIWKC